MDDQPITLNAKGQLAAGTAIAVGTSSENKINGPTADPMARTITYNADGLATVHNCDFIQDPLFQKAYHLGLQTGHRFGSLLHIEWRTFVCCWAAHHARNLAGDYVECGVNTGIYSRAVMEYIGFSSMKDRKFYLLDTYKGLPEEQITDDERKLGVHNINALYFDCYDLVCQNFREFPNVVVVRGRVPDTLSAIQSNNICYVSIDMNLVEPEISAGRFLWPKLVPGAVVVLDDYGWETHINQKIAWDKFASERGVKVLALPTGQGLLIKP